MFKKIALFPIYLYRFVIRPWIPNNCVFHAHGASSCSEYAITSIRRFGPVRGWFLAIWRIFRCHPWQKKFTDPFE